MIRVGIMGAGHMGKTHALDLKKDERVQIIGVADVMEKRAQALALEVGGEAYTDSRGATPSGDGRCLCLHAEHIAYRRCVGGAKTQCPRLFRKADGYLVARS